MCVRLDLIFCGWRLKRKEVQHCNGEKKEMAVIVIALMGLYVLIVVVIALEGIFVSLLRFPPLILNSQMHCWTLSYFI